MGEGRHKGVPNKEGRKLKKNTGLRKLKIKPTPEASWKSEDRNTWKNLREES